MLKRVQHDGIGKEEPLYPLRHPELVSGSIPRFTLRQRFKADAYRKVAPVRVGRLDQIDLPRTVPVLQLLLAGNRREHVAVHLEPYEPLDLVLLGEAWRHRFAMLPQSLFEVGCYADVECAAWLAGENVDAGVALAGHRAGFAARWTLKQVQGDGVLLGGVA
jgi:hypothetical protein